MLLRLVTDAIAADCKEMVATLSRIPCSCDLQLTTHPSSLLPRLLLHPGILNMLVLEGYVLVASWFFWGVGKNSW